jgi:AcrR family transcriptional regulator
VQDKKKQIIDAAIHCFARKGFNATSIQEIVDELGMAKGSIYFYFKSKDDLLISIMDYYGEILFDSMGGQPDEAGLPPREKAALQIERQFKFIREHLDFMRMLLKEPLTGLKPQVQEMMERFRARSQLYSLSHVLDIYGEEAVAYSGDAAALFSGIALPYFEALLFEGKQLDERRFSRFLIRRFDNLMTGMMNAEEDPMLPPLQLAELRSRAGLMPDDTAAELQLLRLVADEIVSSAFAREEQVQSDLLAALTMLKEEIEKPALKHRMLVRAMLALLRRHIPDDLQTTLEALEQRLVDRQK